MEELINRALTREVIRKVTDVIVPLNDTGSSSAFYCVHSVGGSVMEFQYLVRSLGPGQRFYGIQAPTSTRKCGALLHQNHKQALRQRTGEIPA